MAKGSQSGFCLLWRIVADQFLVGLLTTFTCVTTCRSSAIDNGEFDLDRRQASGYIGLPSVIVTYQSISAA